MITINKIRDEKQTLKKKEEKRNNFSAVMNISNYPRSRSNI